MKQHAKGHNPSTKAFIQSLGTTGMVTLYFVPESLALHGNINRSEFLTVLEQYLFYVKAPTVNSMLVAQPGYNKTKEQILAHQKAVGKPRYVYANINEQITLIQVLPSLGILGPMIGLDPRHFNKIVGDNKASV